MQQKNTILVCLSLVVLTIVSCAKKKEEDSPTGAAGVSDAAKAVVNSGGESLVGTWGTTCQKATDASSTTHSTQVVVYEASGAFANDILLHLNSPCSDSNAYASISITGTWAKGAAVSEVYNIYKIDSTAVKTAVTLFTQELTSNHNARGSCGGEWVKGVEKELKSNAERCPFPLPGEKDFDIYKIDGKILRVGLKTEDLDRKTEAKRPAFLDPDVLTRK